MAEAPHAPRLPQLDGLRGLCILLVLAGHALQFRGGHAQGGEVLAGFGVQSFFALSGFVITRLLLEEETRRGAVSLRHFYLRRALRLVPALAALLAAVAGLMLVGLVTDESWRSWLISAAYLRNIGGTGTTLAHLWSLALEEQFYLLWPLLLGWAPRGRRAAWVAGAMAAVVLARTVGIAFALQPPESGVFYLRPWYRADALLVGAWLALVGAE
ncbi:MAG: acyltransferase, partial [Deltaproteobacteria bacterium]|nr:acyltransferase [Deltaproteobacteria bacterium]